jgi:starvation-inducible DNA-binding protein
MRKTLPIAEALELLKDQPDMVAQLQDIAMDKDMVEVEVDADTMEILTILKDSPTASSSHIDAIAHDEKPRIAPFSSISKAVIEEERYTFSPWYIPDSLDAHDEWTDAKEVQQAFWKYLAQDNRDIRLQHNTDIVAGKWVEGATWAWEVTLPVKHPEGDTEYTFPAGTPFLGIVWEQWAWDLIKSGQIRGLSIGGTAQRAEAEMEKGDYDPSGTVRFSKATFVIPEDFIDNFNLAKNAAFITEPTKEGLAAELYETIADIVAFRFLAQGFHWNVKGINFNQFHDLFEEIYEDADSSIDPIAENIRKLNYDAPVALRDFMGKIAQMDIPETNDPAVMSQILYVANEQLRACLTKAFALANALDEQGIANFIAERLDAHGRWQWQLRAVIGDSFADAYELDTQAYGSLMSVGIEKHLSGRHDQSSHAKGSGKFPRVQDNPADPAKTSQEAIDAAIKLRGTYAKTDEAVTTGMLSIASQNGMEMAGLDYRLKSTASLARKIQADSANEGISVEQAAENISDVQRFTMIADEANYVDKLDSVKSELEAQGYDVRVKNFWKEGDPYQGVNMKLTKDGKTTELQIHTKESHTIKETKIHPIYEKYREAGTSPDTKRELWGSMVALASTIPKPANYDQLLQFPDLVVQTFGN